MKQKIMNVVLIILLVISLMIIVSLILKLNEKNSSNTNINETQSTLRENSSSEDTQDFQQDNDTEEKELIKKDVETTNTDNINNSYTEVTYSENDEIVIQTLEETELTLEEELNSSDESISDKAKGVFITLVDFIFYDGVIGGVTFNELTDAGKEKVLAIVNSIDEKIEKRFPYYKENISTATSNAFVKASEIIKTGSQDIKDFSKEKLGEENYNAISDAKEELVYYTKKGVSIIAEKSENIYTKVKDKVKAWYESFKDKN